MYRYKILALILAILLVAPFMAISSYSNEATASISPAKPAEQINKIPSASKLTVDDLSRIVSKISPKISDTGYLADVVTTMLTDNKDYTKPGLIVYIGLDDFEQGLANLKATLESYGYGKYVVIEKTWPKLGMAFITFNNVNNVEFIKRVAVITAMVGEVDYVDLNDLSYIAIFDANYLHDVITVRNTLGLDGTGITVAVIDTGIEEAHPELAGSVVAWADFVNGLPTPYDDNGHGTFVSGIIAARGVMPWLNGNGAWHSFLYNDNSFEFNNPGPATLTYAINVAAYAGTNVTLNFTHIYSIESGWDYGEVYYWFDNNPTPVLLASYTGENLVPTTESFNITVDAAATTLYISFQYVPDGSIQWKGWWIDDIIVYNATNPADIIFVDDVEGPMPPEVIDHYLWARTTSTLTGMAPGANLVGIKVCDAGGACTDDAILNGIEFAINQSVDIISMSLGGPVFDYDTLMIAVDIANYVYGIVPVIAAGNEGPGYATIASPGAAMGAIAVGAATKVDTIAGFSSWGPNPVNFDIKPDIVSYGRYILSTTSAQATGGVPGDYVTEVGSGTSYSTPMVSGMIALIKQANPTWTPEMIRSAIITTATKGLAPSFYSDFTMNPYIQGAGLLNLTRALDPAILPMPAKLSFGMVYPNTSLSATISVLSLDPAVTTATVTGLELYSQVGNDYTMWITAPALGDVIVLNGTLDLNITVPPTVTDRAQVYWGRINLTAAGESYQIIFGFFIPDYYWLNGTVYDITTMAPVPNATVLAVSPDLSIIYNSTTTNATGYFSMLVPSNTSIRLQVSEPSYYTYFTFPFELPGDTVLNPPVTPRLGYSPFNMLVIGDDVYGYWDMLSFGFFPDSRPDLTPVTALDGTLGISMLVWNNSIRQVAADAILSGDFPVVAWFGGGIWYPIADMLDYTALILYSILMDGGVLLSGGDIGWFHAGSLLMQNVAHADWVADMNPGIYQFTITRSHPLTWFLPATTFTIDSSFATIGEGYPDEVVPAFGGFDIANWTLLGTSAIVAYDGRPVGEARTVYYAFPFDAILDPVAQASLLNYTMIWLFDRGAPIYTSPSINISINPSTGTAMAYWTPFDDQPFQIVTYNLYLNGTMIASGLPGSTTMFDLTPYVSPGNLYMFTIEAVDVLNETTSISAWFLMLPLGLNGISVTLPFNGIFTGTAPVGPGASFMINVTNAPVTVQLLELSSLPADAWAALPLDADIMYFDIAMINANGASWMVVNITYPEPEPPLTEDIVPMWFDGSQWRTVSHYEINTTTNTVTMWINATGTSPTLSDLTGTIFVLYSYPAPLVGGYAVASPSSAPLAIALAGLALLGIALLVNKRK